MRYEKNEIEVIGRVLSRKTFRDGEIMQLRIDAGERWDVYAQSYNAGTSEKIRQSIHNGENVKIRGFVKPIAYADRETGEVKRMAQVSILEIGKAEPGEKHCTRWELEGRLREDIYAYDGRRAKGKFRLITELRGGDEREYTVLVKDYALAKKLEETTEPGQILRVRGTLGKYAVTNDAGERFWRPCVYMEEDLRNGAVQD